MVSGECCKHIGSVLRPGELDFQSANSTHCLQCERCKEWMETLSGVEVEVTGVMLSEKSRGSGPLQRLRCLWRLWRILL